MTVRAHYSQGRVVLDEPGAFAEGAELLVVQTPTPAGPGRKIPSAWDDEQPRTLRDIISSLPPVPEDEPGDPDLAGVIMEDRREQRAREALSDQCKQV